MSLKLTLYSLTTIIIDVWGKYLVIDTYAEDIYQHLMRLYANVGNNSMVLKTYERCKDQIASDLGCPLSQETELLAEALLC